VCSESPLRRDGRDPPEPAVWLTAIVTRRPWVGPPVALSRVLAPAGRPVGSGLLLRRDGARPADGRGPVDRGYGAAALGRAPGQESRDSRPLPDWATG
jgi:hypothetical protein